SSTPARGRPGPGLPLQPEAGPPDRRGGHREDPRPRSRRRAQHEARDPRDPVPDPRSRPPPGGPDGLPEPVLRPRVPAAGPGAPEAPDDGRSRPRVPGEGRGWTMSREKLRKLGLDLPLFPTSTVGSFPKPDYLVEARAKATRNAITRTELEALERRATEFWIRLQEELGVDVLVDGEQYRGDMVAYFAETLGGFSRGGLVRSY